MRKKTQNAITHYSFIAESDGERTLKIGQHLAKLWKLYGVLFFDSCGTLFWILAWPSLVVFVDGDFSLIILHIAGKLRMRHVTWRVISWSKRNTYKHIPCPWFWICIYRNGHVKILWLIDLLITWNPPCSFYYPLFMTCRRLQGKYISGIKMYMTTFSKCIGNIDGDTD